MVVLHPGWAVAQGVEFAGVSDGGFAGGIRVRIVKFGGPADAGVALDDGVDFPFPTTAQRAFDQVLPGRAATGGEIESFYFAGAVHGGEIRAWRPNVNDVGAKPETRNQKSE